ncbi:uncharacterized protein [Anabrus simplex]|uniref:uncharacterized protein n=1 Tax=Anabrus simplex TaxID=316456 RepID=UPI0035A272F7
MGSLEQVPDKEEDLSLPSTYVRGKGVANEKGTGFEYKMALLFYLRAQRLTKKFRLGVNVEDAGAFDDLVLTYVHGNEKYRLLIQLKHKEQPNFKIMVDALKNQSGPFSLKKYFDSVKEKLSGWDRSHLVLFTNATLQKPLQAVTKLNPLAEELLSTGGNKNLMYGLSVSSDICIFRTKGGAKEFVDKLVLCCRQANVDEVDDLIKREILLHFRRIVPDLDSRYSELLEEIKKWWELVGETEYLKETWYVWGNLGPGSSLFKDIRFNEDEIKTMLEGLDSHKVHLMYPGVDVQLRSLKVLQALQTKTNLTFFFTTLEDIMKQNENDDDDSCSPKEKSLVKMWQDEKFNLLALDVYTESKDMKDVVNVLKMLGNIVNENRRLLVISDGNLSSEFAEEWFSRTDTCTVHQLDEPSKKLVVERLWERSLNKTEVLSRDTTGELLSVFLLVDSRKEYLLADRNGDTPLQLAVASQNLDMVELLLEMGADTAAADKTGDTSLIIACRKPSSEIVKILLNHGALTTAADFLGDSPLIIAVRNGYTDTVKVLLESNASTTAADRFGCTALLIAAAGAKSEIVDLLLKHGASTRSADLDGNSALHLAVKAKDIKSVKILLENNARTMAADMDGNTPLLIAVSDGSADIVKLLLENNASTTAATMEGDTALLIAVKKGYPTIVKHLIDHGASVNVADRYGLSPLQIAERENHGQIVDILRSL